MSADPGLPASGSKRHSLRLDKAHWELLGLLRFFLAAVVCSSHAGYFCAADHPLHALSRFNGFTAVIAFLFVSGYSIAHSVTSKPKGFYFRRVLRVYPLYLLAIGASLLPFLIVPGTIQMWGAAPVFQPGLMNVAGNAFFLQGFIAKQLSSNPVTWSLSIEMACYLLAPLLTKLTNRKLFALVTVSAAFSLVFQLCGLDNRHEFKWGIPFLTLAWAWLGGFVIYRSGESSRLIAATTAMACIVTSISLSPESAARTALIPITLLMLGISNRARAPRFFNTLARFLGDVSYPLYLFHLPVGILMWVVLKQPDPYLVAAAILAVSCVMVAIDTMIKEVIAWAANKRAPL